MNIDFIKMHSNGNDFIIIDARKKPIKLKKNDIVMLSDRNFGIGCDQLIIMQNTTQADVEMLIYNADGSKAGACGNAAKWVASLLSKKTGLIKVQKRLLEFYADKKTVSMNMGKVKAKSITIPKPYKGFANGFYAKLGNPHLIFFLEEEVFESIDWEEMGKYYNQHASFADGVNVSCVALKEEDDEIRATTITFERGAGITLSCGSAAAAIGYVYAKFIAKQKQCILFIDQLGGSNFVGIEGINTCIISEVTKVFEGKFTLKSSLQS